MLRAALLCATTIVGGACAAPRSTPADDAFVGCGDGLLQAGAGEQCDLGPENGAALTACSKQCMSAWSDHIAAPTFSVDFGSPIERVVWLTNDSAAALGIDGIVRAWSRQDTTAAPVEWRVSHDAVALGRVKAWSGPAWIEMTPVPRLYAVDYSSTPRTAIELPYPFPDGTRPEILQPASDDEGLTIVDQAPNGDVLIAVIIPRTHADIGVFTKRLAPSGRRSVTVDSKPWRKRLLGPDGERQLLLFFDDPGSFITIELRFEQYPDPFATLGPVTLTEKARGAWPPQVRAADYFVKACPGQSGTSFAQPLPIATLTTDGDIYVWQFDHSPPPGEVFPKPFAKALLGSRSIMNLDQMFLDVLQVDGRWARFTDGDCTALDSSALTPMLTQYVPGASNVHFATGDVNDIRFSAVSGSRLYY